MTQKTVIVFVFMIFIFLGLASYKASADFDCLTLTVSSAQSDKDYCQNELTQIEAQLTDLLNQKKEQQKPQAHSRGTLII